MVNTALNIIEKKLEPILKNSGYVKSGSEVSKSFSYKNEKTKYIVEFSGNKICLIHYLEDENNEEVISEWLFDPDSSTSRDAESIANDFAEALFNKNKKPNNWQKNSKKNANKAEGSGLHFFLNRLITLFPELKVKILEEKNNYQNFRYVTFIKENFVPLFLNLVYEAKGSSEKLRKTVNVLNNFYENGDMDVRSTITIVILNSLEKLQDIEKLNNFLKDDLKNAFKVAYKFKGKKVKPEKVKKTLLKRLLAASANNQ